MTINTSAILNVGIGGTVEQYRFATAGTAQDLEAQVAALVAAIVGATPAAALMSFEVMAGGNGAVFIAQIGFAQNQAEVPTQPLIADCIFRFVQAGEQSALLTETARVIGVEFAAGNRVIGQSDAGAGAGASFMIGFVFADPANVPPPPGAAPDDTLLFGANSVLATTVTRFLFPSHVDANAMTTAVQWRLERAGTLRNFRMRHNVLNGNGGIIDYTVRINSVPTAITVPLASTTADGSDLANSVVVAANDLIDVEVTKVASVGTSPNDIIGSLGFGA